MNRDYATVGSIVLYIHSLINYINNLMSIFISSTGLGDAKYLSKEGGKATQHREPKL